ncbi:MAG TPA: hypothetical protein VE983_04225, partial [Solirubrobacteraceae bacterium]|nr:hypothetical protein [Solirubrobacteraceae bacterium]
MARLAPGVTVGAVDSHHEFEQSGRRARLSRGLPPAACVLAYCLVAVAAYWPVSPFSSSWIMGCHCGDPAQEAWFLTWPLFAISHLHNPLYSTWIGYPVGVNLAANTAMPLLGVIAAPVTALAGPVAAYNFLLRLGFAASATSAFFVLRRWTQWQPAAFIGGLVYGFSPFLVGEGLGHAFLNFAPVPPLMFLVLSELLLTQRRPAWQSGLTLGALAVAQLYISSEILLTTTLMAGSAVVLAALARPRLVATRARHALTGLGWAAVLFLVLGGYDIWFFLAGPQHIVGPPHSVASLSPYHADLLSAVIPTRSQRIAPFGVSLGDRLVGFNITETGAYIGIPLLMLLVGLVVRYRDDARVRLAAALAIWAYVLSMGARLVVDGYRTHVPLPFAVLEHVPIVQGADSGRFSLFTNFFIAVLLSIGLSNVRADRRLAAISHRRLPARTAALVLSAVCLVPLLPRFPYHEVA